MKVNFKIIFILLSIGIWISKPSSANTYSQDDIAVVDNMDAINVDSSNWDKSTLLILEVRSFNESQLNKYKENSDFQYGSRPKFEENWWQRLKRRIAEWLMDKLGNDGSQALNNILYYLLMVAGIVALIFFLTKVRARQMLKRQGQDESIFLHDEFIDVAGVAFDTMIREAEEKHKYRLAIRLRYLKSLQLMDEYGIIQWKDYKTNHDYYFEIEEKALKSLFIQSTNLFEIAWYGHIDLDKSDYAQWKLSFDEVNNLITKKAA